MPGEKIKATRPAPLVDSSPLSKPFSRAMNPPTGPHQFATAPEYSDRFPHVVYVSMWAASSDSWHWTPVANFKFLVNATVFIDAMKAALKKAQSKKAPRLTVAMAKGMQAVIFSGFDGYDYRGNLVQVRKGVAKIAYYLGEGRTAITYLNRDQWHRIKLA
jgi:hypothetical protein